MAPQPAMDQSGRSQTEFEAPLQAISVAVHTADPRDSGALVELLGRLKDLDGRLQISSRRAESQVCALGMRMTERLLSRQQTTPEDLLLWVNLIVQHLAASLGVVLSDEWQAAAPRPSRVELPAPRSANLRMAMGDGHRLGEVLVQMSYLKASDVERALLVQRESGCRLGEAMVMLGLITQKGLDAALKIQQRKRATGR